jgi:hypothetical protein
MYAVFERYLLICRRVRKIAKSDSFVTSVCPSAWNNSAPTGRIFMKFDIWEFFEKSTEKNQVSLKWNKNNGHSYMKTNIHLWQYLAHFFLEWEMFQTKVVEKIKTHILCTVTFFRKSCRLWDEWKNIVQQGRHYNMAHAHCMLST